MAQPVMEDDGGLTNYLLKIDKYRAEITSSSQVLNLPLKISSYLTSSLSVRSFCVLKLMIRFGPSVCPTLLYIHTRS